MTVTSSDPRTGHQVAAALTVDDAHAVMLDHLGCDTSASAARQAALGVLVAAGLYRLVPDPGRSRPAVPHPYPDDIHRDRM